MVERSYGSYDYNAGHRGAFPPAARSGYRAYDWMPPANLESEVPNDDPFDVGDGAPDTGPVADNIQGGDVGDPGDSDVDPGGLGVGFDDYGAGDFGDTPSNIIV
jgi:hypothetical protein